MDAAGSAYVTDVSGSKKGSSTSAGSHDRSFNGQRDAFVTKVNAAGTSLVFSTFLGGSQVDFGLEISPDPAGNIKGGGDTESSHFPIAGGFDSSPGGRGDSFLAVRDPTA